MWRWFVALVALAFSTSLSAQTIRDDIEPPINSPAVASVGDRIYEKSHLTVIPAYVVDTAFSGKNIFAHVVISPGDKFIRIPSKATLKACRSPTVNAFLRKLYDACLYDDDGDGTFDRFGGNEVQGGKRLPQPIPYKPSEFVNPTSDSLKQTVIYLGSTSETLRLSYREFVNDMARPAFTEEYTFPLGSSFPQPISFKGVKVTITAIDGDGLHYSLTSIPTTP
jgi:hypothetical protein